MSATPPLYHFPTVYLIQYLLPWIVLQRENREARTKASSFNTIHNSTTPRRQNPIYSTYNFRPVSHPTYTLTYDHRHIEPRFTRIECTRERGDYIKFFFIIIMDCTVEFHGSNPQPWTGLWLWVRTTWTGGISLFPCIHIVIINSSPLYPLFTFNRDAWNVEGGTSRRWWWWWQPKRGIKLKCVHRNIACSTYICARLV